MSEGGEHRAPDQGWLTRINLSEPVRLRLYAITAAAVALLSAYGLLDDTTGPLWLAGAAAILGFTVTPWVRASVVSPATAARLAMDAATADHLPVGLAARRALDVNSVPGSTT